MTVQGEGDYARRVRGSCEEVTKDPRIVVANGIYVEA